MNQQNKIPDEQIVKALKFAISQGEPDGIGFWDSSMKWQEFSIQDILDFINSQKEEIEQLNKINAKLQKQVGTLLKKITEGCDEFYSRDN